MNDEEFASLTKDAFSICFSFEKSVRMRLNLELFARRKLAKGFCLSIEDLNNFFDSFGGTANGIETCNKRYFVKYDVFVVSFLVDVMRERGYKPNFDVLKSSDRCAIYLGIVNKKNVSNKKIKL